MQIHLASTFGTRLSAVAAKSGLALAGLALSVAAMPAAADDVANYPERTISWVVPFPPGGAMDAIARWPPYRTFW